MRSGTVKTSLVGVATQAKAASAAMRQGLPALMVGETGSGKTSLAKDLAAHLGRPFVRVNLDGGTTVDEVIGRYQLKEGATVFEYGVIPNAMKAGAVLVLDELNAALPDVLFCIHALLERPPRLFVPETQEDIAAAEGFCVVATMNPSHEYAGTKELNAALYSRFAVVLRFDSLRGAALIKALGFHVPKAPGEMVAEIASLLELIEGLRAEDRINTRATVREGISALLLATDGLSTTEAIASAIVGKLDPTEQQEIAAKYRPRASSPYGTHSADEVLARSKRTEKAEQKMLRLEKDMQRYAKLKETLAELTAQEEKKESEEKAIAEAAAKEVSGTITVHS